MEFPEGIFGGEKILALKRKMERCKQYASPTAATTSSLHHPAVKKHSDQEKRNSILEFQKDMENMTAAKIEFMSEFNDLEEIVKWARISEVHVANNITVYATKRLLASQQREVQQRAAALLLPVQVEPQWIAPVTRVYFDHWMSPKDDA